MVGDAQSAIAEINSGLIAQGYYSSVVVLMDEDRSKLETSARAIEKAVNRLGFVARIETINTMDAYIGSLPGHGVENVRRPLINTLNLADLLPTSTIWTGKANAPCPLYPPNSPALMHCVTHGYTPFRLNLHVGDIGHTFMFGPTGAGKSVHLAILAAQLRRYKGMSIFVFDKGMSMYPLAAAINAKSNGKSGIHFTVAADDEKLAFCPLQFLETKADRAWAMEWIDTILALNGVDTTPQQRKSDLYPGKQYLRADGYRCPLRYVRISIHKFLPVGIIIKPKSQCKKCVPLLADVVRRIRDFRPRCYRSIRRLSTAHNSHSHSFIEIRDPFKHRSPTLHGK
jgi:type IV secretion system protein VirB4